MKKIVIAISFLFAQHVGLAQKESATITTSTNLKYKIVKQGTGLKPLVSDKVTFHYKGTLEDGTVFDDSYKRGAPLDVMPSNMIKGLQEGLSLMPLGSTYIFYIPSNLAYGTQGGGSLIKPNANVIFEVELLKVNDKEASVQIKKELPTNEINSADYKFFLSRGLKFYKEKKYTEALADAEKALAQKPTDTSSLSFRGMCKASLDDNIGAIADYTSLVKMIGDRAGIFFFRRGLLYEVEKNYPLAKADYEKMLQLKPDFKEAIEGKKRINEKLYAKQLDGINDYGTKMLDYYKSIDPDRPFMKLIKSTNEEIAVNTKRGKEISNEIDKITDKSRQNNIYMKLISNLVEERNKVYRILMKRSKELEAFNDERWPIFKAAYRKLLIDSGIEEKYLKDY